MAKVLLKSREELSELALVELDPCLAERVDQMADAGAHDLATFATVEALLLNLRH